MKKFHYFIFNFLLLFYGLAYASPAYHHSQSFLDTVVNSFIHAIIYGIVFKIFKEFSLTACIIISILGLFILYLFKKRN